MPSRLANSWSDRARPIAISSNHARPRGRLPVTGMMRYSEAGVRKASREETAGEFAPAAVSVYGDLAPVYALIFGLRTGTTALRNRFIIEMADSEPLEFPLQGSLLRRLW